jgi:hypothetical protein
MADAERPGGAGGQEEGGGDQRRAELEGARQAEGVRSVEDVERGQVGDEASGTTKVKKRRSQSA